MRACTFFSAPNRVVVEQGTRSPDCASEIFDHTRAKLDSCCSAAGNSRFVNSITVSASPPTRDTMATATYLKARS